MPNGNLILFSGRPGLVEVKSKRPHQQVRRQRSVPRRLGWSQGLRDRRHYFFRQLRDIKISIRVETFGAPELDLYATWCGRALALSHARSGSTVLLSGYMGKSQTFDKAIAAFSRAWTRRMNRDRVTIQWKFTPKQARHKFSYVIKRSKH